MSSGKGGGQLLAIGLIIIYYIQSKKDGGPFLSMYFNSISPCNKKQGILLWLSIIPIFKSHVNYSCTCMWIITKKSSYAWIISQKWHTNAHVYTFVEDCNDYLLIQTCITISIFMALILFIAIVCNKSTTLRHVLQIDLSIDSACTFEVFTVNSDIYFR